jgi:hypothetical protein
MYLAPNDTQMVPLAIFCGLHEAELPPDLASMPYLELLRMDVEAGGHLGHFPYIYTTDKSEADKNLWRRHAVQVVAAWRDRGCQIMSPFGAHCNSTCETVVTQVEESVFKPLSFIISKSCWNWYVYYLAGVCVSPVMSFMLKSLQ